MAGTRWVKIDTLYLDNPKIIGLHPESVLLHLASILWTTEQSHRWAYPEQSGCIARAEGEHHAYMGTSKGGCISRASPVVTGRGWLARPRLRNHEPAGHAQEGGGAADCVAASERLRPVTFRPGIRCGFRVGFRAYAYNNESSDEKTVTCSAHSSLRDMSPAAG